MAKNDEQAAATPQETGEASAATAADAGAPKEKSYTRAEVEAMVAANGTIPSGWVFDGTREPNVRKATDAELRAVRES